MSAAEERITIAEDALEAGGGRRALIARRSANRLRYLLGPTVNARELAGIIAGLISPSEEYADAVIGIPLADKLDLLEAARAVALLGVVGPAAPVVPISVLRDIHERSVQKPPMAPIRWVEPPASLNIAVPPRIPSVPSDETASAAARLRERFSRQLQSLNDADGPLSDS